LCLDLAALVLLLGLRKTSSDDSETTTAAAFSDGCLDLGWPELFLDRIRLAVGVDLGEMNGLWTADEGWLPCGEMGVKKARERAPGDSGTPPDEVGQLAPGAANEKCGAWVPWFEKLTLLSGVIVEPWTIMTGGATTVDVEDEEETNTGRVATAGSSSCRSCERVMSPAPTPSSPVNEKTFLSVSSEEPPPLSG
jgi:hypothetical protein